MNRIAKAIIFWVATWAAFVIETISLPFEIAKILTTYTVKTIALILRITLFTFTGLWYVIAEDRWTYMWRGIENV